MRVYFFTAFFLLLFRFAGGQSFYFGNDLSYVNEMEACGAAYYNNGEEEDVYQLFADQGCNLVRLRLWHTPAWHDVLNSGQRFSDFDDVRNSIERAKNAGMDVLLDFQLSDNWADPGNQVIPVAWEAVADDLEILQDSLYQYVYSTLEKLWQLGILPEMVQIGNETNKGILQTQAQNDAGWGLDWPRNQALFNTAIQAVRDIEDNSGEAITVAIHIADPANAEWLAAQFWENGVQDFDLIGLSYYPAYHGLSIASTGNIIASLKAMYPGKEVMILETAVPWTNAAADPANNLINVPASGYELAVAGQRKWLEDLTQKVIDKGGIGVVYWEPAWVSTGCSTQWAEGSHWENCTFFDFDNNLIAEGGIGWMSKVYDFPVSVPSLGIEEMGIQVLLWENGLWLRFENENKFSGALQVVLYSLDGRRLVSGRLLPDEGGEELFTTTEGIAGGVYLLVVAGRDGGVGHQRIFIP